MKELKLGKQLAVKCLPSKPKRIECVSLSCYMYLRSRSGYFIFYGDLYNTFVFQLLTFFTYSGKGYGFDHTTKAWLGD